MSKEFSFDLTASANASRYLLESASERELAHWDRVVESYRAAKAELIRRLDPATGRRVIPVALEATQEEIDRAFTEAVGELHPYRSFCQKEWGWGMSPKWAKWTGGMEGYCCPLEYIYRHRHQGPSTVFELPGAKQGQKPTRALAAVLRAVGVPEKDVDRIVTKVGDRLQATRQRRGHLVISANILDILMASEAAAWTSCHSLDGCHRAGPQQYLHDPHTLIAYYYEATTEHKHLPPGVLVPKKLWRQMVYVDLDARAAAFQREYGQQISAALREQVRGAVAVLLRGGQVGRHYLTDLPVAIDGGARLAYVDPTVCTISIFSQEERREDVRRQELEILLAGDVPCGCCGEGFLQRTNLLTCSPWGECGECGTGLDEDEAVEVDLCQNCAEEHTSQCDGWGGLFYIYTETLTEVTNSRGVLLR